MQSNSPKNGVVPENIDLVEVRNDTRRQCLRLATNVAEIYDQKFKRSGAETDRSASKAATEVAEAIASLMEN